MADVGERVDTIQEELTALIRISRRNEARFDEFVGEMRDFKKEMQAFKDEMLAFKDESLGFREDSRADRREMWRQWGALANRYGGMVESIVHPNVPGIARRYFGFDERPLFHARNVYKRNIWERGDSYEIDSFAAYDQTVFVAEARATVSVGDAEKFVRKLAFFTEVFPEYASSRIVPIICSLYIPPALVSDLTANGVYAMVMGEETMDLVNAVELDVA